MNISEGFRRFAEGVEAWADAGSRSGPVDGSDAAWRDWERTRDALVELRDVARRAR